MESPALLPSCPPALPPCCLLPEQCPAARALPASSSPNRSLMLPAPALLLAAFQHNLPLVAVVGLGEIKEVGQGWLPAAS